MNLQSARSPREWVEAYGFCCEGCGYDRSGKPRRWRQYSLCLGCVLAIQGDTPIRYASEWAAAYSLSDGERAQLRAQLKGIGVSKLTTSDMGEAIREAGQTELTLREADRLERFEARIETNLKAFYAVGETLITIRDERFTAAHTPPLKPTAPTSGGCRSPMPTG